jgi:hypothetical protein
MYNDDYRDFEPLDEFEGLEELNGVDEFREDEDEFVEFVPPFGCPFYRQQFPGGQVPPPRPPQGGFPGGAPGGFPGGAPGGFPGGPEGGFPGGAPTSPPPNYVPQKAQAYHFGAPGGAAPYAIDPGAIRRCRYRYSYIWLRNGVSFWAWITYVGRRSIAGYRWNGRRWVYFGIDTRRIDYFVCY